MLDGGGGNDVLVGGNGIDTVVFSTSTAVVVDLASGLAQDDSSTSTLDSIENVQGGAFDDVLTGNASVNRLEGGDGDDLLDGGGGDDTLIGGAGSDTAAFSTSTTVVVDLAAGFAQDESGTATLLSIENAKGGAFDDTLTGNVSGNRLEGGDGDDLLDGGGGNDVLVGDAGIDTVVFSPSIAVVVDLAAGFAQNDSGTATLLSIENVQGGAFDDTLIGDSFGNTLEGGGGDDSLDGGGGNDTLIGGEGSDTASFSSLGAVFVNLVSGFVQGENGSATLVSIENARGGAFDDVLTGNSVDNELTGGGGDDLLNGGGGNDDLVGGSGTDALKGGSGDDRLVDDDDFDFDSLDGGSGFDLVDYSGAAARVVVNLTAGYALVNGVRDAVALIEGVRGTALSSDSLTGNELANTLEGGDGDDSLNGRAGNDQLVGGLGIDTAHYSAASAGVTVDLQAGTATGGDGTDTLIGIENATGSVFVDILLGTDDANVLMGRGGDDTLDGRGGIDTANYSKAAAAVTVDLLGGAATGGDGNDTLVEIENVAGSAFGDELRGDGEANGLKGKGGDDLLAGQGGDDSLNGGAGADLLAGGAGRDVLRGAADSDTFRFDSVADSGLGAARDVIADFEQGSDRIFLAGIDADTAADGDQAFSFVGRRAFSGVAGELRATTSATTTLLRGDIDGDKTADFQVALRGVYTLQSTDFVP